MDALEKLTKCLGQLPGVGRRSAERMALKLVLDRQSLLPDLVAALEQAGREIGGCSLCGSVTPVARDPCHLCTDSNRDGNIICVVETPNDILIMEKSGGFRGRYHALMGRLSPMKSTGIDELRIRALMDRIRQEGFKEVLLALSTDVEGDATAAFLAEMLKGLPLKVSRLAFGLPSGSGIGYSDPITLTRAIQGRQDM